MIRALPRQVLRFRLLLAILALGTGLLASAPAWAVYSCGGVNDTCKCGANNPYPCCDNGGNCTWFAWHSACCNWGVALPGWGNANTWGSYASQNGNFQVVGPTVGAIATSTKGTYGHVAYVVAVGNGTVTVHEENCCGTCKGGAGTQTYSSSYFNSGYVIKKPTGPVCGNGQCQGGENCANCPQDCGGCCGNGACDNGENCSSCSQDCGSCCGNGACDWGENCSTCSKDCGACCGNGACDYGETCESCSADCHCLPSGSLDSATCSGVQGWAWDSDAGDKKVQVRLKVGDAEQAMLTADQAHAGHDGRGFAWSVPASLKNGQVCTITAEALDTQTPGTAPLGQKSFVCDNAMTREGIWTTHRTDAAGIDVTVPPGAHLGLQHAHAENYAYPLSGVVETCATLGLEPFDLVTAALTWNLASKQHRVELAADGLTLRSWQDDSGKQDLALEATATELCLRTVALTQVEAPKPAKFLMEDLQWHSGLWWHAYSQDAAGILIGHPQSDAVLVQARAHVGEGTTGRGWVRSWVDLPQPYDALRFAYTSQHNSAGQAVAGVLAGQTLLLAKPGDQIVRGLQATRMGVQVGVPVETTLGSDLALAVEHLRILQNTTVQAGPWSVGKHDAWGLDARIPEGVAEDAQGLALALRLLPMNWWATGSLAATVELEGPAFERVRGRLTRQATETAAQLGLLADDQPVATLAVAGTGTEAFDLAVTGHRLTWTLAMTEDRPPAPLQGVRLDGLEFLRQGWWTADSPECAGLRDDRLDGGGVRLQNVRSWGTDGRASRGHVRAHRAFAKPMQNVRFHYKQNVSTAALRVLVLADGLPLREFDDEGALEQDVTLQTDGFTDLAFVLAVQGQGGVYKDQYFAEFSRVEVQAPGGKWTAVEKVASAPSSVTLGADAGGLDAGGGLGTSAAGTKGSGCQAGRHGASWAWALTLLGVVLVRRRLRVHSQAGA